MMASVGRIEENIPSHMSHIRILVPVALEICTSE
jgi:hypothetical protein